MNLFSGKRKAQEEAPVELLIGVTILTFVMIIGAYMINTATVSQEELKIRASLNTLARDIEFIYFGTTGSTKISEVDFTSKNTENPIESIRIVVGLDSTCNSQIGKPNCMELVVVANLKTSSPDSKDAMLREYLRVDTDTKIYIAGLFHCDPTAAMTETEHNLVDEETGSWGDPDNACWFRTNAYTLKITKKEHDAIEIKVLDMLAG
ncbi:MAG: hypothetical protein V1911_00065 [Candidatus Micrarchaeota archaeon]